MADHATVANAIPFDERPNYSERFATDASVSKRFLVVDWDDSALFKEDMLGFSEVQGDFLYRQIPEVHPLNFNQYCVDVNLVEVEGPHETDFLPDGHVRWERCIYECTYRALKFDIIPNDHINTLETDCELQRYVVRRRKWAFEQQKIPGGQYVWDRAGHETNGTQYQGGQEVPARPFIIEQWEYTWMQIPREAVPTAAIRSCANKVNNAVFDQFKGNFPAGTLLFLGVDEEVYFDQGDREMVNLKYLFAYRVEEWNKYMAADGSYQYLKNSANNNRVFGTALFDSLFQVV